MATILLDHKKFEIHDAYVAQLSAFSIPMSFVSYMKHAVSGEKKAAKKLMDEYNMFINLFEASNDETDERGIKYIKNIDVIMQSENPFEALKNTDLDLGFDKWSLLSVLDNLKKGKSVPDKLFI